MKKTVVLILMATALIMVLAGCTTMYATTNGKLSYAEVKGTEKGTIRTSKKVLSIIHPSVAVLGKNYYENLDDMIDPALKKKDANAVKGMTISQRFGLLDYAITYFTAGILNSQSIIVEGTAVKQ